MIATLGLVLVLAADGAAPAQGIVPSGLPGSAAEPDSRAVVPADTLVRVPGSPLRLGWRPERTSTLGSFPIVTSAAGQETREGEVRWFGSPARASLTYRSGRLGVVRLTAASASPRLGDYVPDELRRLGYRRVGVEVSRGTSVTHWEGAATIRLTMGSDGVVAEVSARAAREPVASLPPPVATVIDFTAPGADSLGEPRRLVTPADPVRPRIAVDAGVFGRVVVVALVGAEGLVEHAEIERGIPELDNAALEWASAIRFEPWLAGGRPARFRVRIPVAFLPARSGGGSRP